MHPIRACLFLLILCLPAIVCGQSTNFEIAQLADGVYAALRKDPPGFAVESNSVFIIGDDSVIVVDAQSNISTAKRRSRRCASLRTNPCAMLSTRTGMMITS
jgi:hypothetical protein